MFDMIQIGKKISELRKINNMTQMELADQLGISFQAVSNWERGNTMPDISKLPELAGIFHVSLDELLNGRAPLIESTIEGTLDNISEDVLTEENIADALPLLKPQQAEDLLEKADISSFKNINAFLPFLNEDDVNKLAHQALEKGGSIHSFLPFLTEDDVAVLAKLALEKGESIHSFLPFLTEDDVAVLAKLALEKGENIHSFLPFLIEDDVIELAYQAFEKRESIESFLPFLPESVITELAMKALKRN